MKIEKMLKKSLVVVLAFVAIYCKPFDVSLLDDEFKQTLMKLHDFCVQESKVDEEHIKKASTGVFNEEGNLNCYMKCFLSQIGVMDNKGIINFEAARELFPENLRDPLGNVSISCQPELTATDLCNKALQLFKCGYKLQPEYYFLF